MAYIKWQIFKRMAVRLGRPASAGLTYVVTLREKYPRTSSTSSVIFLTRLLRW